jgi:hypothetical protein
LGRNERKETAHRAVLARRLTAEVAKRGYFEERELVKLVLFWESKPHRPSGTSPKGEEILIHLYVYPPTN